MTWPAMSWYVRWFSQGHVSVEKSLVVHCSVHSPLICFHSLFSLMDKSLLRLHGRQSDLPVKVVPLGEGVYLYVICPMLRAQHWGLVLWVLSDDLYIQVVQEAEKRQWIMQWIMVVAGSILYLWSGMEFRLYAPFVMHGDGLL